MSLSLIEAAHAIRDLITEKSEAAVGFSIPMIASHVSTACEPFARMIATSDKQELLRPNTPFTNTIVNGSCDLTQNLVINKLLLDYALDWEIRLDSDPNFPPFHMIPAASQLIFQRPCESMFITAAVDGQTLRCRNIDGALDADLGGIQIQGNFIPIIAESAAQTTLPVSLEGEFLLFAARMLLGSEKRDGRK